MFLLQTDPPKKELLPPNDALGVTIILIVVSYNGEEFVRVGYYVNVDYSDAEKKENPPEIIEWNAVSRSILADKPRVTKFPIAWDGKVNSELTMPVLPPSELDELQDELVDAENEGDDDNGDSPMLMSEGGRDGRVEGMAVDMMNNPFNNTEMVTSTF